MTTLLNLSEIQLIAFALTSSLGAPVTGLGTGITVQISKNGGAFAASTGTKAEIGSGWYSYELSAAETDTVGPLAVTVTGAGALQANLSYQVSGADWAAGAGPNILTTTEAAAVLRCAVDDPSMLMLLPAVDAYIEQATGRDWTLDATIYQEAKNAARILITLWHENPAQIANSQGMLPQGLTACLVQLEALALELETSGLPDDALAIVGSMPADGASEFSVDANLVIVFNHAMAASATSAATLKTTAGAAVVTVNALDVTGKILTINPTGSLAAATNYQIILTAAADQFGQTLTETLLFKTA